MCDIGLEKESERLELAGSAGYPGTDEMPHLARMLGGRIEMVDIEDPETPMVTVPFRMAHTNIATDK